MSQKNKLHLNELSDLFMTRNKIIKNTTYYNRLYSTKPTSINISLSLSNNNPTNLFLSQNISMNKNNIDNSNINTKEINKNKITNRKILSVKNKSIWPKVTKPKWPFSLKRNEPRELRMSRLSSATPSEKYHNFNTIRWLNQKYSDSVKQKSIYSLLPNNGKRRIPENETEKNKRHRKIIEYLESFRQPKEREKNVDINPKYFYNKQTFEKIKGMKEMFIMFDKEGKQKMVLKEMVRLFKNNGIEVDLNELKDLFYKNMKNINPKNLPINLLYLDFYQFMKFALTRDQDFRLFIRKLMNKKENKIKKKGLYFPMNFNLALDYFMRKEKQRNSIKAVKNAINDMDKMMKLENEEIDVKNNFLNDEFSNLLFSSKSNNSKIMNKSSNILDDNDINDINFSQLIDEFSNLFGINNFKTELDDSKPINKRKEKSVKSRNITREQEKNFTNDIKAKLRNETLKDLNIENFGRYNNLKIAMEATKEQIKFMKTNTDNKIHGLIEEDKKTINMVDIRDIINQNTHIIKTPEKIFNVSNTQLINIYLKNKNRKRKKRNNLKERYNSSKSQIYKKQKYNFYCGSPKIINNENKSNSKYDFVPSEFLCEN